MVFSCLTQLHKVIMFIRTLDNPDKKKTNFRGTGLMLMKRKYWSKIFPPLCHAGNRLKPGYREIMSLEYID
jgi:hypothetical protein